MNELSHIKEGGIAGLYFRRRFILILFFLGTLSYFSSCKKTVVQEQDESFGVTKRIASWTRTYQDDLDRITNFIYDENGNLEYYKIAQTSDSVWQLDLERFDYFYDGNQITEERSINNIGMSLFGREIFILDGSMMIGVIEYANQSSELVPWTEKEFEHDGSDLVSISEYSLSAEPPVFLHEWRVQYENGRVELVTLFDPDNPNSFGIGDSLFYGPYGIELRKSYFFNSVDGEIVLEDKYHYSYLNGQLSEIRNEHRNHSNSPWYDKRIETFLYDSENYLVERMDHLIGGSPKYFSYQYEEGLGNFELLSYDPFNSVFQIPNLR